MRELFEVRKNGADNKTYIVIKVLPMPNQFGELELIGLMCNKEPPHKMLTLPMNQFEII